MLGASAGSTTDREALAEAVGTSPASARPRVLQVITKLDLGGAESVAVDLVGALRSDADFAVFAVFDLPSPSRVGRDMADRLAAWNVPLFAGVRGHFKKGGVLLAAWRLARAARQFRADIVHLHTEVPEITGAVARWISPGFRRVAVLRTVHNSELWIAWGGIGRWVTERLAGGTALAVSQAAADADAAIATRRARPRPAVVPNGVAASAPAGIPREAGSFRLLFAGRYVPAKGGDLLPAILRTAHAATERRDVEVTIAGAGPQEELVRAGLEGVAPGWSVHMVPPIEQLGSRMAQWDALLMPSRFEGLPLLAIEAFSAGLPVIATAAPGLGEVLPQDYPYHAAVDDAAALGRHVAAVIDDLPAARAIAAPLTEVMARQFSPEAMTRAYARAYAELAERKRHA